MQTFLTSYDLAQNARQLDRKRLFKQKVEGYQILNTLTNKDKVGWKNHPAVRQWSGYELALVRYIKSIWDECQNQGIAKDSSLWSKVEEIKNKIIGGIDSNPIWWGQENITSSHRSRLKCKGLIDIQCSAIKKSLKIKKIDDWLKSRYNKTKNQLRYSDSLILARFMEENRIELTDSNFYENFGWSEGPDQEYVWPK